MMITALLATVILLTPGEDPRLEPQPITVRKRNGQWELRLKVRTEFPQGTIIDLFIQPRILKYRDLKKVLVWEEPESFAIERSIQVGRNFAELRLKMAKLCDIRVTYMVDPHRQRNGLKLKNPVIATQDLIRTGSVIERLKAIETWYEYTLELEPQLRKMISRLEKAQKDSSSDRRMFRLADDVSDFREKCRRRLADGTYPGTVGYLDYVSADVLTLCSWLTSHSAKTLNQNGGDENYAQWDNPGINEEAEGAKPTVGLMDKTAGNILTESFTRLGSCLDVIPDLHRAETFILLLTEARLMVEAMEKGEAVSERSIASFRKAIEYVEAKLGEERLPVLTMNLLKQVLTLLEEAAAGTLPTKESSKGLINLLEKEEAKVAQLS
jgi:hypothetical protein